ncbi:Serine/threonine-protein phosphatase BSL1 [Linum grandiflorum]
MRRCRHASASIGVRIYVYGGLKGDVLLDDFLVAENSSLQSDGSSPILTSEKASPVTSPRLNHSGLGSFVDSPTHGEAESPPFGSISMDKISMEKLREASAAEAQAASAVWQAAQASVNSTEVTSVSDDNSQAAEATSDGSDVEADVRLHPRAVVVAKEAIGNLGGMVRQLSLDQFENESRRMVPATNDTPNAAKRFTRQKSPQGLHKKVISTLLRPRNWKAPTNRRFFLDSYEIGELCYAAEQIFMHEPTVLQLKAPVKVFGDLHGQFGDLMRLFDEYGFPSTAGDITYIDYLFLGDYVDRGQHSLETITLLLALKGESDGIWAWTRFNQLFNYLPLAALIEKKIICMHGGIGRSITSVEQIEKLERPITMDAGSIILMDLLWSDPTENDSVEGLRPNARGPGLVTFGPDRVTDFCKKNKLQLIIRAHECVMDGFERFAQGQLITLFSATNYCGTANNAGAILVVGRGLVVVPKLIHPLPPPLQSPETSPERTVDETWMQELNIQRPPTPTRGRPQPDLDRNSLAYI